MRTCNCDQCKNHTERSEVGIHTAEIIPVYTRIAFTHEITRSMDPILPLIPGMVCMGFANYLNSQSDSVHDVYYEFNDRVVFKATVGPENAEIFLIAYFNDEGIAFSYQWRRNNRAIMVFDGQIDEFLARIDTMTSAMWLHEFNESYKWILDHMPLCVSIYDRWRRLCAVREIKENRNEGSRRYKAEAYIEIEVQASSPREAKEKYRTMLAGYLANEDFDYEAVHVKEIE